MTRIITIPSKKRGRQSQVVDNSIDDDNTDDSNDNNISSRKENGVTSSVTNLHTPSSSSTSPSALLCWKCKGYGKRYSKLTQSYDGEPCKVCNGHGTRRSTARSKSLANQPGKIVQLRGYPEDHPFKVLYPEGFSGPRAIWGSSSSSSTLSSRKTDVGNKEDRQSSIDTSEGGEEGITSDGISINSSSRISSSTTTIGNVGNGIITPSWQQRYLPQRLRPSHGEVVGSLSGDWRIYQVANGNKLTVDDFICAWVASHEMKKRGWVGSDGDDGTEVGDECRRKPLFGGISVREAEQVRMATSTSTSTAPTTTTPTNRKSYFTHADLGTGCGSVLMMVAWAFLGQIQSVGVEAQDVSFDCLQRGLLWNLGRDGSSPDDIVRVQKTDLRRWNGIVTQDNVVDNITLHNDDDHDDQEDDKGRIYKNSTNQVGRRYHLITGTPPYFPLDSFVASENHEQKVRCRVPTRGGAMDYIEAASRLLLESQMDDTVDNDSDTAASHNNSHCDGGVFCMVEAAFDKAEMAVLKAVEDNNMTVQRRLDVITREGLPPRFSCWVMTMAKKMKKEKNNDMDHHSRRTNTRTIDTTTTTTTLKTVAPLFPIETLTLRNKDLSRTKEYSTAMEEMGWVDFERSNCKSERKLVDFSSGK